MAEENDDRPKFLGEPPFTVRRQGRTLDDNPDNSNQRPDVKPINLFPRPVATPVDSQTPDTPAPRIGRFGNRINEPEKPNPDPPTFTFVPDTPNENFNFRKPLPQRIDEANAAASEPLKNRIKILSQEESDERIRKRLVLVECSRAIDTFTTYLSSAESQIKPENLKDILNVLEVLPLRKGNIFDVPENRPAQRTSAAVVVPIGSFLASDPDNTPFDSVRRALRDKALQYGIYNPESYVAKNLGNLLGLRNNPDKGEPIYLDVRKAYGEGIPLPDALVFVNTVESVFSGDTREIGDTVSMTKKLLQELSQKYREISFPPFNVKNTAASQALSEFLLAFAAGSLQFAKEVASKYPGVDPGDIVNPPLQYVEVVVSDKDYDQIAEVRDTLLELLKKQLPTT